MYKKELSYKDYSGQQCTETFWFHLNEVELMDIEVGVDPNGMLAYLEKIQKANDKVKAINFIKMLIRKSFGVRSDDGKQFIKTDRIWAEFEATAAYPTLFMTLMRSEIEMEAFVNGITPEDVRKQMTVYKKNSVERPLEYNEPVTAYVPKPES